MEAYLSPSLHAGKSLSCPPCPKLWFTLNQAGCSTPAEQYPWTEKLKHVGCTEFELHLEWNVITNRETTETIYSDI
jgi:hypothetical protein